MSAQTETKSRFTKDGNFVRSFPKDIETIGDLREAIKDLPEDLPVHTADSFMDDSSIVLDWCNVGKEDEHIGISSLEEDED